jgi:hypothetical protein
MGLSREVVRASLEEDRGDRCVDLIEGPDGWAWVECRRDPEDGHGWRRLHPPRGPHPSSASARAAARDAVGWLDPA